MTILLGPMEYLFSHVCHDHARCDTVHTDLIMGPLSSKAPRQLVQSSCINNHECKGNPKIYKFMHMWTLEWDQKWFGVFLLKWQGLDVPLLLCMMSNCYAHSVHVVKLLLLMTDQRRVRGIATCLLDCDVQVLSMSWRSMPMGKVKRGIQADAP